MDYNTKRDKLVMPEYGRSVQQMVNFCKGISDREERTRCAQTIVKIMSTMAERTTDKEDFQKKLWNHLAAISGYELDIDYPVEIVRMDDENSRPERLRYPQHPIKSRNYGAIVEAFANFLHDSDADEKRDRLTLMLANHMKRDLSNWSLDSMSDERVADDLARYTGGKVTLDLSQHSLISDGELLSNRVSTTGKKKKKKK